MTRWTHLPGHAKQKRRYRDLEGQMQIQIAYCIKKDFPNLLFTHPANGGRRSKREAAKFKAMGQRAGTPDLLFWWKAASDAYVSAGAGAIELKSEKGRLTPEQEVWRDQFQAAGGKWALCRTYAEVKATLEGWGISNHPYHK